MKLISIATVLISLICFSCKQEKQAEQFADYVNPFIGVIKHGACMPGPCLPQASVYPSPNTLNGNNSGYRYSEKITGFAQLHTQGNGGVLSYGNFLISPQTGLRIKESEHASDKENEKATAYCYSVGLKDYNIQCELAPASNSAIYDFTFSESDSAIVLLDVGRKNGGKVGLKDGFVNISDDGTAIRGGGVYGNNWPDNVHNWNMYFYMQVSKAAQMAGVFEGDSILANMKSGKAANMALGAYVGFKTHEGERVTAKIAVSFISTEHAKKLLENEIPDWDLNKVKAKAKETWNEYLSRITIKGSDEEKTKFYTHLFHSFVQPRNRTGNNLWKTDEDFWDDHYTMWDSWKTLFPLMCLIDQDMVAGNVRSFINRHKHNGYVATAFVNGKESPVGQGGNTVDNVIGDAFVKDIPGINWEDAYKVLKYNADSMRTKGYLTKGYMPFEEKTLYSWRIASGSATLAFAYNDYCAATLASALGHEQDAKFYSKRSENWKNVWNEHAESDGYKGFIMGRNEDGSFNEIDPKSEPRQHFYEGSCWEYSYVIPHDILGMVEKMGGRERFVNRLVHALDSNLIRFSNEPSFMTLWLFATEEI